MKPFPVLLLVCAVSQGAILNAQASYELRDGYRVDHLFDYDASAPFEMQVGGLTLSTRGEPIVNEGGEIRLHSEHGVVVLASFRPGVFGSFLTLDPDGASVWFGESSQQNIYRIPLDGSGPQLSDRIGFNFDMAFAPRNAPPGIAGRGFISGLGTSPENSLWLLDNDPEGENDEIISHISPFSGPIAFDEVGNLYLVTSGLTDSKTGAASEMLVRFSPAQLAGALGKGALELSDGELLCTGMGGYYNIAWLDGKLYGTSLGFQGGMGSIDTIDPAMGFTRSPLARLSLHGTPGGSMLYLAARGGREGFEPGRGHYGGILLASYGNYVDASGISRFTPELYFLRGDVNDDATVDLSDAVSVIAYLFLDGENPRLAEASDINGDGSLDLADAVYLLNFLYRGGPRPPAPFPQTGAARR